MRCYFGGVLSDMMTSMGKSKLLLYLLFGSLAMGSSSALTGVAQMPAGGASLQKVDGPNLPNAYRLHENVIFGGQPNGESGIQELQKLGVKTIISVDGAKPNVSLAKKFDMRYVHLPHGYDGISDDRTKELAKAVRDLPGPIYIHCHHGKHRSPAAATVACVSVGLLNPKDALGVLAVAGTSRNYRGLYQSVESARPLEDRVLNEVLADFRASVELPPLAEAMVEIEQIHDRLTLLAKSEWKAPNDDPDLNSAHEALLLKEHFVELLRKDEIRQKPARFQQLLRASELAATQLEAELQKAVGIDSARCKETLYRVSQNCVACHREFRDVPLAEKP